MSDSHDIFREILQSLDLLCFLFEGRIELRVIQRDRDITRDGEEQFHIFSGQEIAVYRFAQPQNGDGVIADAARNEVMEVEMLDRAADRLAGFPRASAAIRKTR